MDWSLAGEKLFRQVNSPVEFLALFQRLSLGERLFFFSPFRLSLFFTPFIQRLAIVSHFYYLKPHPPLLSPTNISSPSLLPLLNVSPHFSPLVFFSLFLPHLHLHFPFPLHLPLPSPSFPFPLELWGLQSSPPHLARIRHFLFLSFSLSPSPLNSLSHILNSLTLSSLSLSSSLMLSFSLPSILVPLFLTFSWLPTLFLFLSFIFLVFLSPLLPLFSFFFASLLLFLPLYVSLYPLILSLPFSLFLTVSTFSSNLSLLLIITSFSFAPPPPPSRFLFYICVLFSFSLPISFPPLPFLCLVSTFLSSYCLS